MNPGRIAAVGYACLAAIATGLVVVVRDGNVLEHPAPWLALDSVSRVAASLVLGGAFAAFTIVATRVSVARYAWARALHDELRPIACSMRPGDVVMVAVLSSVGEEVFFRALLTPAIGVVLSGLAFGLAHQMRGPSRWVWVAWATVVGMALGALFALTGSLTGCVLAHAVVNGCNLFYLRASEPSPPSRPLGGLLRRAGRGVEPRTQTL